MDIADRTARTDLATKPPGPSGPSTSVRFDIAEIPFSRRGSWLDLSPVVGLHARTADVHLVSHTTAMTPVLALVPEDGQGPVEAAVEGTPSRLTWRCSTGSIDAVFETTTTMRLRGQGIAMLLRAAEQSLTPFTGTYLFEDPATGAWVFTTYETGRRYRVTVLAGAARATGAEALGRAARELSIDAAEGARWEVAVEELRTDRRPYVVTSSFDDVVARVAQEFDDYVDAIADWRTPATPAAALAAYVLWSATVEPAGFVGREAVLMSKHWMDSVWSWDHCFNALALARGLPQHALDQFLLPFDHQDGAGALPDSVTHSRVLHNFVKPPIHGWAFRRLRAALPVDLDRADVELCYERLSRWSTFWLDHRVAPGRTLPSYQHGNDSGWDNSTVFDQDRVVESADLATFLAIQLDVLAELADGLGQPDDAASWTAASKRLREAALDDLWDGDRFTTYAPLSGRRGRAESLLTALPIIDGATLPRHVLDALARQIGGLLTDYGPATEPPSSDCYESDGYWRGPIWAPSTLLVEDGLRQGGYVELADDVSARFRRLCEESGFAENFDALSGKGLRDRAYTWTAATYLVLSAEYVQRVSSSR